MCVCDMHIHVKMHAWVSVFLSGDLILGGNMCWCGVGAVIRESIMLELYLWNTLNFSGGGRGHVPLGGGGEFPPSDKTLGMCTFGMYGTTLVVLSLGNHERHFRACHLHLVLSTSLIGGSC